MLSYKKLMLLVLAAFSICSSMAQEDKKTLIIDLAYHLKNNQFPYLTVFTKTKEGKVFPAVGGMEVSVYINEEAEAFLLGKVKTDASGKALIPIGAGFKAMWDSSNVFTFIASSPGTKVYETSAAEISITKAKILIDTVAGAETRTLMATVMEQGNNVVPANEVELKIIVNRMAGNLSVGDAETYTTDSTGAATAEFKRDSIPGDKEGYIIITAKAEDNDKYGNISIEKKVKWGTAFTAENNFGKRTLFATRDKSPVWLLALAYSIGLGVWGAIIYLVIQVYKMRKLGLAASAVET
jgi:hypothetical protein